ncbi:penicillin-binding protein 2X [Enterococcus sp. PF1-24]|uniref:penicillin-binding protein n=1 Tax=unclassified Enterococcus TaxID=2608891 RepID=UPI002474D425|nr:MULTISPECIES: penicillin-binding protein [unclassified Enterococcus]MDH6364442.1 penicillin-binding protein 2X [Enterococcus sp. PFB1-1]MDH6401535.1 penicillin-binding protein 2X [Enterococcus sp. PF1-24]
MKNRHIKKFINKRNLNPVNNRKKVGIILFATSIGLFFLFAARLSYIVIGGHVADVSLQDKVDTLYKGTRIDLAERGRILDRNGDEIARNSTTYKLKAILSEEYISGDDKLYAQETDFSTLAAIVAENLEMERSEVLERLQTGLAENKYQVEFGNKGRDISIEKRAKIEEAMTAANVKGLYFDEYSSRIYPNGTFASHLIGYASLDKENPDEGITGQFGIEAAYDKLLSGVDGETEFKKNIYGMALPGTVESQTEAIAGADVYTTIDRNMQSLMEDEIDKVWSSVTAENFTGVLMEAKTGEIIAMAQRPTFNPETMVGIEEEDFVWRNLFVEDKFEPGSTIKVATVASAIDDGVFNSGEYYPTTTYELMDSKINDWDDGYESGGSLNFGQALAHSSNIGMVKLEERMEALFPNNWDRHLAKFGFGKSTYSGLTDETAGSVELENIVDKAMSAYGQAIGVNQFQMLQMFTAIANDGKMIAPHYVKKVEDPITNEVKVIEPEVVGQPVSAEAANMTLSYMQDVINTELGTAYKDGYVLDGYNIAAKTGTAEVASEDGTGYRKDGYINSVVLMYPAEEPQYILYLTTKLPVNWSNAYFAQIANPIMKRSMELLDSEEYSYEESTASVKVTNYENEKINSAAVSARRETLNPIVLGSGDMVQSQSLKAGSEVAPNTRMLLYSGGDVTMPDTTGWTADELQALGDLLNIEVSIIGDGHCVSQSVEAETALKADTLSFTLGY